MNIYFDNAATTKVRDEVIDQISDILKDCFGNPSSTHSYGRSAKSYIEISRKKIAEILNCEASEIIFNSGGTEADNSLLKCSVKDFGIERIISSKIEHHAITHTLDQLEKEGVIVNYVDINNKGEINYNHLEELLNDDDDLKLVSLMYVNNEIGNITDVDKVSDLCKKNNSFFHTDAVQAVGHYKIDLKKTQIDFLSASAHKFHGPKGVGFSFIRKTSRLSPFICGGPQERGLRGGTESSPVGLGRLPRLQRWSSCYQLREFVAPLADQSAPALHGRCRGVPGIGASEEPVREQFAPNSSDPQSARCPMPNRRLRRRSGSRGYPLFRRPERQH